MGLEAWGEEPGLASVISPDGQLKAIRAREVLMSPLQVVSMKRSLPACNRIASWLEGWTVLTYTGLQTRRALSTLSGYMQSTNKLPGLTNRGNWEGRNNLSIINRWLAGTRQIKQLTRVIEMKRKR